MNPRNTINFPNIFKKNNIFLCILLTFYKKFDKITLEYV